MTDYDTRTADELRDELRERNLPTSGTKPELAARLEQADAAFAAKKAPAAAGAEGGKPAAKTPATATAGGQYTREAVEPVHGKPIGGRANVPDDDPAHAGPAAPSAEMVDTVEEAKRDRVGENAQARVRRDCVVDDGTPHMGSATPGSQVCSAHANRYHADGTPRDAAQK